MFTIRYSVDGGQTVETWGPVQTGGQAVEKAMILRRRGAVIYGIYKNSKRW